MCGIAGFISPGITAPEAEARLARMSDSLRHRGPDDSGFWFDPKTFVGLGHRRLAVFDPSPAGRNPMVSQCGTFVLTLNGEIYNFRTLRKELEESGTIFRSRSDSEVAVNAFAQWGVRESLPRFRGMFAFAAFDTRRRLLTLGRDRMGEKPLHYGILGRSFIFASEPKAFTSWPAWNGTIEPESVEAYLRIGFVPAPLSIFRGFFKLEPGSILEIPVTENGWGGSLPHPSRYWSLGDSVRRAKRNSFAGSIGDAADRLGEILCESVQLQMAADVPLGAFLSGGTDSSLLVSLIRKAGSGRILTFTLGNEVADYDEKESAAAIASHLGTEHVSSVAGVEDASGIVQALPGIYDEPFGDSSAVAQVLVSRLARGSVTVCLSGDGADELFGGYTRHIMAGKPWSLFRKLPALARRAAGAAAEVLSPVFENPGRGSLLPRYFRLKAQKFAALASAQTLEEWYLGLISAWPGNPARGNRDLTRPPPDSATHPSETVQFWDSMTYLPDDILVKVDRAAMAVGLETRAPFLDPEVIEFAWSLPAKMKAGRHQGKIVLRHLLARHIPPSLLSRGKAGFSVPIGIWLRTILREWAEWLLESSSLSNSGYLNVPFIRQAWKEHLDNHRDWHTGLWNVLMFQAWFEEQKKPPPPDRV